LDNLNERVENTRVQITDFIKVQNELKSKIETPENIKGKSNVEPKFNIVAKVKIQEGEENIIKSKEKIQTSQTNIGTIHKERPQLEGRGAQKGRKKSKKWERWVLETKKKIEDVLYGWSHFP
jgi:hypothetical protein